MIHLYIKKTGKPACGAPVDKGNTVTQAALYKDLCVECRQWQMYRCAYWKTYRKWPPI